MTKTQRTERVLCESSLVQVSARAGNLRLGREPPDGAEETHLTAHAGTIDMPPTMGSFVSPAAAAPYSEVHCLGIGVKLALNQRFLVLPVRLPTG